MLDYFACARKDEVEHAEDRIMPQWLIGLLGLAALVGFIGFALRQGTKVAPDRNNHNFGPTNNDGWSGPSDSGSGDGSGHSF
jgi:hypothetical protein